MLINVNDLSMKEKENRQLNLTHFIQVYDLDMIMNNGLIQDFESEIINYESLINIEDVKEWIQEYNNEILEDYEVNNVENLNNIGLIEIKRDNLFDILEGLELPSQVVQYFIINQEDVRYWEEFTTYPIYYFDELDIYQVGIDHLGINWKYINTSCPLPLYLNKYLED